MCAPARSPMVRRSDASLTSRVTAPASEPSSLTTKPVTSCLTISRTDPTSVDTTGTPADAASISESGTPSLSLVKTTTSSALSTNDTSSCQSRNFTLVSNAALATVSSRSGPLPTKTKVAFGTAWARRTKRSGRLIPVSRPTNPTSTPFSGNPSATRACLRLCRCIGLAAGMIVDDCSGFTTFASRRSRRVAAPTTNA